MARKLLLVLVLAAGCKNTMCARKSDCAAGSTCSAAGVCELNVDAGATTDATTPDGGS